MDYQDKPNYIREYIEEIESGRVIVSKKVKKVYIKWMKPIINDEHPLYYFNPNPGLKFIKFSETYCRQSKGEWSGKKIELMLWQKAWAQTLFGTLRRDTHHRRFTESFLVVARKNGKTHNECAFNALWNTPRKRSRSVCCSNRNKPSTTYY